MPEAVTPIQFVRKWSRVDLSERAASQEHFIDLCRMLGQPTPAEHDATGAEYTFEKGAAVLAGASRGARGDYGFADVWWRRKFAWEYKRKGKYRDFADAYRQLCQYREALENPPLLIVSDIARTEIHTNFTGTAKQVHVIELEHLAEPESLDLLRRVFTDPESFKPTTTAANVTEAVAAQFATLATALRARGHDPHNAAHFLMRCMFCLFAEDIGLLPGRVFEKLLRTLKKSPDRSASALTNLFAQMRTGGMFGSDDIPYFNGGLFDQSPALELEEHEIDALLAAAAADWSAVEPAIFGTLFERSLDPDKRAQIGAHYTSREDILLVVEPVVIAPLRREWSEVRAEVERQIERRNKARTRDTKNRAEQAVENALRGFIHRLASVRILDPACGSGNFLYVAVQRLLELEKEVITFASRPDIALGLFPQVRPTQLHGLEINPYAAELAQVVIWIGYLQWMRDNGFAAPRDPILEPLQSIECRDAILAWEDAQGHPLPAWQENAACRGPAKWPETDFIIGNPPFLGGNMIRQGLGDQYVEALFDAYDLPNFSDLCCYWFELARRALEQKASLRVGLLATQGIRGGVNREVLHRLKQPAHIFNAWSDREWILDGAAVHISIICFETKPTSPTSSTNYFALLNGEIVTEIHADLTGDINLTQAAILQENLNLQFEGDKKGAAFDLSFEKAREILSTPHVGVDSINKVCRPWANALDITRRWRSVWIIDFGVDMQLHDAAKYQAAFEHIRCTVAPEYENKRARWWLHERPRQDMRRALDGQPRYLVSTRVSKHRLFTWLLPDVLPDSQLIAFARSDDYFFGVLHSSIHELWALRMGTQLEDRPRYTPTTCFETFPLPWPPGKEPADDPLYRRIADAAKELNEQRERWLNPLEWLDPIAHTIDTQDDFSDVPAEARPLVRWSAIMAAAAKDANLKRRTLTNLYNERPTWLKLAHEKLDRAVLAAYAAVDPQGAWSEDWAALWTETGAGQPLPPDHDLAQPRAQTDQQILANLLRLNQSRTGG